MQDASYRYFDQHRANMPEQTKILNVMGDIGDGSDGVVTNFSSAASQQASAALARLLQTFKARHVNQVVLVGHSMGSTAALRVLLSHPIQDTTYPTVTHLVTIAAPFNSGLGILLHGYGSSARATTALATAIQTQTHLKRRQQVNVSPQGMVKLSGTARQLQQGGIYQLNFTDKQTTESSIKLIKLMKAIRSIKCLS
ncbi:alpha/beta hydrolase|uniref:Alpha/beta hydrolase n=1 Tax=Leuconostoc lactis TaxID=1246 RepID=A0A6L7A8R8_LEULA|nr:alpha/beta hydrolase [Leuconostoc lactis]